MSGEWHYLDARPISDEEELHYIDAHPTEFGPSSLPDKYYEVLHRIALALERIAENTDSVADYFDLAYKEEYKPRE